ncbi:MAG TPA: M1 family aminopeptidase [Saprospiraceae bacterium]|nr:M1 family aminopeptidase [Saprospiraceae bacterium]
MFKAIYLYELSSLLKQPAPYIYAIVFFAIALLSMLGTGGYFDGVAETDEVVRWLNSAHEIGFVFQYFNKFFLFLLPALIGMVIYKDFKHRVHPILYTYPIRKLDYLLGKFLSALTVVVFITFSIGIAFLLGEFILGQENPMIGPTNYGGYLSAYGFFVLPNVFSYGLIIFSIVATFRNIYAGFIAVIFLFILQVLMDNLFAAYPILYALFDPFGQNAITYETQFWTLAEQNTQAIPVWGMILWNRGLWISLSLGVFYLFFKQFQLEQETFRLFPGIRKRIQTKNGPIQASQQPEPVPAGLKLSRMDFSIRQELKAMLKLSTIDLRFIIKNWLFYVLVFLGILALVFALDRVTNSGDLTYLPLTRIMLSVPMYFFSAIIVLLTFIYSGMLVHRSRMAGSDQLIDVTPTSNWVLLGSKVLALMQVQVLLLLLLLLCGIGLQVYNGFYHFEIGLYLFHLFLIIFPTLVIWAAISVFTHTVMPNVYLGLFLLLLLWLGKDQLPQLGIESFLLRFNSAPQLVYSDLNGFGHGLRANAMINTYWLLFAGMILILSYLFWERGFAYTVKERFKKAISSLNGIVLFSLLSLCFLFCFLGMEIYQEENSPLKTPGNNKEKLKKFRADFGKYRSVESPKITSVNLDIHLYPARNSFLATGSYLLVNKTSRDLDTILVKRGYDEITSYTFDTPARLIQEDSGMQFAVHVLEKPLPSGDSMRMRFTIQNRANTLFYQNSTVLRNGTFLRTDILPRLAYFWDVSSSTPTDSLAGGANFYSPDADLVDIETRISTHPSQTALAPGKLLKHWQENERNFFHYKTTEKIKFAFAFHSGIYAVDKNKYKDTDLEIYHHEKHPYNLRDMVEGLKAALDYNTHFFGPYQHQEVRIVAFPHTQGTYASVMGNAIPTSEVRFVLNNKDVDDQVNLSFYVQAHELTHQWWGNQLVPADALGAKMLTESITEYLSLRIYEKYFGQEKALQFLSFQRQRYLRGRAKETGAESPLYLVEPEQAYIAYGKGAMAFNTLRYHLGEEKLNSILNSFLQKYKFRTDRYPTSLDLISHLKEALASEYHYIISDMMESIIFYDNSIKEVKELTDQGVEITFEVKKLDASLVNELAAGGVMINFGQYDNEGNLLRVDSLGAFASGEHKTTLLRAPRSKSIVLDPLLHFVELNIDNNRMYLK